MGYIHITSPSSSSTHLLQITATRELWFYLAITAPLMLVTICGWWAWELWSRHRGKGRKGWMGGELDEEMGEIGGGGGAGNREWTAGGIGGIGDEEKI